MKESIEVKKVIIFYSIVAILLVCILPWTTPVKKTLNAVKLDAEGNELGTVQIQLEGKKRDYLFRTDRFDVDITPFDNFQSFGEALNGKNVPDVIWKLDGDISYVHYGLSYKDELRPAIILIPGRSGSLGIGKANIQRAIERAVGADIL